MNILLVGFFGEGNLGDDAIAEAIASVTPQNFSIIITAGYHKIRATYKNFNIISRKGTISILQYIQALKYTKKVIFCGGILHDWSFDGIAFFAIRMLLAYILNRQPSIWGAGLGPFRFKHSKIVAKKVLKFCEQVWLRDIESLKLYKSICSKNASLGADWSWIIKDNFSNSKSLENNFINTVNYNKIANQSQQHVVLNLRPWQNSKYYNEIKRLLEKYSLSSTKFYLVAARHEDIKELYRLAQDTSTIKLVSEIYYPNSFKELLNWATITKQLDLAVAMRYHIVLAFIRSRIPLIVIPYDSKVVNVINNIKNISLSISNITQISSFNNKIYHIEPSNNVEKYINYSLERVEIMRNFYLQYLYS